MKYGKNFKNSISLLQPTFDVMIIQALTKMQIKIWVCIYALVIMYSLIKPRPHTSPRRSVVGLPLFHVRP